MPRENPKKSEQLAKRGVHPNVALDQVNETIVVETPYDAEAIGAPERRNSRILRSGDSSSYSQISDVCLYYENNWTPERLFSIRDALNCLPPDLRREAFKELVCIDISLGVSNKSSIELPKYKAEFPSWTKEIDEAYRAAMLDSSVRRQARIGRKLGNLRLEEMIGKGGMGVVYKAFNELLRRYEAVKYIAPTHVGREQSLDFIRLELATNGQVKDPRFARAYDAGTDGHFYYLAMEYVDGVDLAKYLRNERGDREKSGPIPIEEAARYVCEVAKGLVSIHRKGIIHRDIKPENIMLDEDGEIRVLDLGLAKWNTEKAEQIARDAEKVDVNAAIVGTPAYMSPEAFSAPELVDERSDIYCLGGVFFFLITGERPVKRFNPRVDQSPKSLGEFFPGFVQNTRRSRIGARFAPNDSIRDKFLRVLEKMLEPDRDKRYKSASKVVDDLEKVLAEAREIDDDLAFESENDGEIDSESVSVAFENETDGEIDSESVSLASVVYDDSEGVGESLVSIGAGEDESFDSESISLVTFEDELIDNAYDDLRRRENGYEDAFEGLDDESSSQLESVVFDVDSGESSTDVRALPPNALADKGSRGSGSKKEDRNNRASLYKVLNLVVFVAVPLAFIVVPASVEFVSTLMEYYGNLATPPDNSKTVTPETIRTAGMIDSQDPYHANVSAPQAPSEVSFRARPCEGGAEITGFDGSFSGEKLTIPSTVFIKNASGNEVKTPVVKIGNSAFGICHSLKSVVLPKGLTQIDNCAFYMCGSLSSVAIPEGVVQIGDYAFHDCDSLKTIILPKSVATIGENAFPPGIEIIRDGKVVQLTTYENTRQNEVAQASSQKSISKEKTARETRSENPPVVKFRARPHKGGAEILGIDGNFSGENLVVPPTILVKNGSGDETNAPVVRLGSNAFYGCKSLKTIELPQGLAEIGVGAFGDCESLTTITLPEGLTSIGIGVFSDCNSLTSITLSDGLTSIGSGAFSNCKSLTSLALPKGLTSIGASAFAGCEALTSIALPDGLTTIGDEAFSRCSSLKSIALPRSVVKIGENAFPRGIKTVRETALDTKPETERSAPVASSESVPAASLRARLCEGGAEILGFEGNSSEGRLVIPNKIVVKGAEAPVVRIAANAFTSCGSLTSIALPDGLTTIGYKAFYNCGSLASIELPRGLTSIGERAFSGCKSLKSIVLPEGLTTIGDNAFSDCDLLTSVVLSEGLKTIDDRVFSGCKSLKSIELPKGLTTIGDSAFSDCAALKSISLPEGLTSIDGWAFSNCKSLTSINLPKGLKSIGNAAFSGCEALKSIALPDGLTTIGARAFGGCGSLTTVAFSEGLTTIGAQAFIDCDSLSSIALPKSVKTVGKNAFPLSTVITRQ